MNIAEYIEQNMDGTSYRMTVFYHRFKKEAGLKDIRTAKEWIENDLLELFKCKFMKRRLISCIIVELWFTATGVVIDFSHWINELRKDNPHWLSDMLKQTILKNYVVKGN
ncbi:hypothetical protein [uncultured Granulicatella sp.]|uniref:hypothetical protein n=1 Tax=uncultured Granulicatella sp. TaxID=316089 RepID=UPI0028D018C5|nr:hypothetical protein [uncultured Granulicatella sp.]